MNDDRPVDLGGVYAGREPRGGLEEWVVGEYRRTLGVGPRAPSRAAWIRWAAAVALFAGGVGVGRVQPSSGADRAVTVAPAVPPVPTSGRSFMFLLFQRPDFGGDQREGSFAEEYAAWARELASAGVAVRGSELDLERVVLPPAGGVPEEAETFRLGGYFVVEATDMDEARRVAETHPHMGHGGWIEVAEMR